MNDFFDSLKEIKKELTKEQGVAKKPKKRSFLTQKRRRSYTKSKS
ncbi:hypothetical protein QM027_05480 [Campylobacter concisus]